MEPFNNSDLPLPDQPYRGIEPFRYIDQPIFFARDEEISKLLRYISIFRGVLFYGDSGSGKSSLINAGLLPLTGKHGFIAHRIRVQPESGGEFIVERISIRSDNSAPYLPSILTTKRNTLPRVVLSIKELKQRLNTFRLSDFIERLAVKLKKPKDVISKKIKNLLSTQTVELLYKYEGYGSLPDILRQTLTEEIEQLIATVDFLDTLELSPKRFSKKTEALIGNKYTDKNLVHVNRVILEEIYSPLNTPTDKVPLLIFDQFEEFVTLFEIGYLGKDLNEKLNIQKSILSVLVDLLRDPLMAVKVLFVFREDYLAKFTKLFILYPDLRDQYVRLTAPNIELLPQIIRGPFEDVNLKAKFRNELSDQLTERLTHEIERRSETTTLNLSEVQIACLELWKSSSPEELYEQKGIQGLLEDYLYNALYQLSTDRLRDPAIALLSHLVTPSGTRNILSEEELIERVYTEEGIDKDVVKKALDALEERTKLVRRERRYGNYFYEIVSEFLVPWISQQKAERTARLERLRFEGQIHGHVTINSQPQLSEALDKQHLEIIRKGVMAWNLWRKDNPLVNPQLATADLSGMSLGKINLRGANLSWALLSNADLREALLADATLYSANLHGANLSYANLTNANLQDSNLTKVDLSKAKLGRANLRNTKLRHSSLLQAALDAADLREADLYEADMREANLSQASLQSTNLSNASLQGANLSGAILIDADLSGTKVDRADLTGATCGSTKFTNLNLVSVKGLESLVHLASSSIGVDTLFLSSGMLPEAFLRGVGIPDTLIAYIPSITGQVIQFYSCFISYSSKDQVFAQRLYSDLQSRGVRCWFAPEDLRPGERFRSSIDVSIQTHDKLLLILSENSTKSSWIEQEVETALEREQKQKRIVIFPIRIDNSVMNVKSGWLASIMRTRHIGDFTGWKSHDSYQQAFDKLLRDLRAEEVK
jgi:uncharacterized protein YjbI with pentapeptide repeats